MNSPRALLLAINLVGGVAVLGSYAWGGSSRADAGTILWGGVPERWKPIYVASMLLAAVGYLAFTAFLYWRVDPGSARVGGLGYGVFALLYVVMLAPSAAWMPLTLRYASHPSPALWWCIRGVLALVGAGGIGMVVALARLAGVEPGALHRLAIAGAVAFACHTTVLDGVLWPAWYPRADSVHPPHAS